MQESIEPFVHRKIVVLNEDDTVESASRAMCQHEIGCVLVSGDDGKISGIVTDRDLACYVMAEKLPYDTKLHQFMSRRPVTVDHLSSVYDAVQVMKEYGVRRIPVVEALKETQRCVGLITLDDLIAKKAVDIDEISAIVKAQIQVRQRQIPKPLASAARADQTYHEFLKKIGERLDLKEKATEEFLRFVLGSLVMRMPPRNAAHLIAQLPLRLQQNLKPMMVGPDKSITAHFLEQGVAERFTRKDYEAVAMLRTFWAALSEHLSGGAAERALGQLPRDIQHMFKNGQARSLESLD